MGAARFTVISEYCVRIEWAADGRFVDEPSLFAANRAAAESNAPRFVVVDDSTDPIVIERSGFSLRYQADGQPLGSDPAGAPKLWVRIKGSGGSTAEDVVWRPGLADRRNLGGTLSTLDTLKGPPPRPYPTGLLSRSGWSLIDDSAGHLLVDGWAVCRDWRGYDVQGRVDWTLFAYGDDYSRAFEALARVSGPVPVPRRSVLGSWFSRYWPYSSDDFRTIVEDYAHHGFPLDVMVLDMDWHSNSTTDGWTGWSWNRRLLPDAELLMEWLHAHGLDVTLNLHPAEGVGSGEDRYHAFMRAMGADPSSGHREEFDAGNRRYMQALFGEVLGPLEAPEGDRRRGVDFWWLDWQQDQFVRSVPGLTNLAWLNTLFFRHTARDGLRGQSFSRWAGWGDHRHPIHFSGDAHTGWPMLRFQVPFTVAAGNVGCFFWSHDVGGHYGPRFAETTARWVQFAALSAAVRLHSARIDTLDRRPWTFEENFRDSMRSALLLRSRLMPQIYSEARRACEMTIPLMRAMSLGWPGEERAYTSPGQYMLGEDLLAAPIVTEGLGRQCVATTCVWFPPTTAAAEESPSPRSSALDSGLRSEVGGMRSKSGTTSSEIPRSAGWFNLHSGEHFDGGTNAIIAAELDEIPLFARGGTPIFMQPETERMCAGVGLTVPGSSDQTLIIRLFPGVPGEHCERELLEDDGKSSGAGLDYTKTVAATKVRAVWHAPTKPERGHVGLLLTVEGAVGTFEGQPTRRRLRIELACASRLLGVTVDALSTGDVGLGAAETFDRSIHSPIRAPVQIIEVPLRSIREQTVVRCDMNMTDTVAHGAAVRRDRAERLAACEPPVLFRPREEGQPPDPDSVEFREDYARVLAVSSGMGVVAVDAGPCAQELVSPRRVLLVVPPAINVGPHASVEIVDQVGPTDQVLTTATLQLDPSGTTELPDAASSGELEAPAIGRIARRLVQVSFPAIEGLRFSQEIRRRVSPITRWKVLGPFAWDWRRSIREQGDWSEVGGSSMRGAVAAVQTGAWACDLTQTLGQASGLAYAVTSLLSPRRQMVRFSIDAADKVAVRINGVLVFEQDGHWTEQAAAAGFEAEFKEGLNEVMVKCPDGWSAWGFTITAVCPHALAELGAEDERDTRAPMHG